MRSNAQRFSHDRAGAAARTVREILHLALMRARLLHEMR
jgi:hypothetical protein